MYTVPKIDEPPLCCDYDFASVLAENYFLCGGKVSPLIVYFDDY